MKLRLFTLVGAFCATFVSPLLHAEASAPKTTTRIGKFDNGVQYAVVAQPHPAGIIELRLRIATGSLAETPEQAGLAHFVEHAVFRGTSRFPGKRLTEDLAALGAQLGPDLNAFTAFDQTVYMIKLPAASADVGLRALRDIAGSAEMNEAVLATEKKVVLSELRERSGAPLTMFEKFLARAYPDSGYSKHLPIGTEESINSFTAAKAAEFYRTWYRPDLTSVVVVGDLDPEVWEKRLREEFGSWVGPKSTPSFAIAKLSAATEPFVLQQEPGMTQNMIGMMWVRPRAFPANETELRAYLAAELGEYLLQEDAIRAATVPGSGLLGAFWSRQPLQRRDEWLSLLASCPPRQHAAALTTLNALLAKALSAPPSAVDFDRARVAILSRYKDRRDTFPTQSSDQRAYELLNAFEAEKPWIPAPEVTTWAEKILPTLTPADVHQSMLHLKETPVIHALVAAEETEPPTVDALRAAYAKTPATQPAAAAPVAPSSLLPSEPEPQAPVRTVVRKEIGVVEWHYANGLTVVVKQTPFEKATVQFYGTRRGGLAAVKPEQFGAAHLVPVYSAFAGLGPRSMPELMVQLAGKRVGLQRMMLPTQALTVGQFATSDMSTFLSLLHLSALPARDDEDALMRARGMIGQQLSQLQALPQPASEFALTDAIYGGPGRALGRLPSLMDLGAANLASVKDILHRFYGSVSGTTYIFVGDVSPEALQPLADRFLGSLPAGEPTPFLASVPKPVAGPRESVFAHSKEPKGALLLATNHLTTWNRDEGHVLWSLGNIATNALTETIRMQMGATYSPRAEGRIDAFPEGEAVWKVVVACSPDKVAEVRKITEAVLRRLRDEGPTEKELSNEIAHQRSGITQELTTNNAWMRNLSYIYHEGEDTQRLEHPDRMLGLLTAERLKEAARKHVRIEEAVVVFLQPEATLGKTP